MRVEFLGAGSLMLHCLRRLRAQGRGTLIVLSTVATERPRASNAIYGAAKTGLDALAQGRGDGLAASGVRVLTVRPGFVITRMTAGLKPPPFATTPEAVADATVAALARRARTVWVPSRPTVDLCCSEAHAPPAVPEAAAVTRGPGVVDVGVAVALAIVVVAVEPGVAVGLVLVALLLALCAVTLLLDRRRARRSPRRTTDVCRVAPVAS